MKQVKVIFDNMAAYNRFMNALISIDNGRGITLDCLEDLPDGPRTILDKILDGEDEVCSLQSVLSSEPVQKVCNCVTKATEVNGMRLIYVQRECPFHGQYWQV